MTRSPARLPGRRRRRRHDGRRDRPGRRAGRPPGAAAGRPRRAPPSSGRTALREQARRRWPPGASSTPTRPAARPRPARRSRGPSADLAGCVVVIEAVAERLDVKRALFADVEARGRRRRRAGHQHLVAVGDRDRRRAGAPRTRGRPALLQPGRPDAAGRGGARRRDRPGGTSRRPSTWPGAWGKTPVVCTSTPGFIVNRVARPYYGEAQRMVEEGVGRPGDHRRGAARGRRLPARAVRAHRPGRPGRQPGRLDVGVGADLPRPAVRADGLPAAPGRRRTAGSQERPRGLHATRRRPRPRDADAVHRAAAPGPGPRGAAARRGRRRVPGDGRAAAPDRGRRRHDRAGAARRGGPGRRRRPRHRAARRRAAARGRRRAAVGELDAGRRRARCCSTGRTTRRPAPGSRCRRPRTARTSRCAPRSGSARRPASRSASSARARAASSPAPSACWSTRPSSSSPAVRRRPRTSTSR